MFKINDCKNSLINIYTYRYESALIKAIHYTAPLKMIDVMIENYPEEMSARDEIGMHFSIIPVSNIR